MAQPKAVEALGNIRNTPELWQKITFTMLCLLVYRIGSHVTAPGIDVTAMLNFFQNQGNGRPPRALRPLRGRWPLACDGLRPRHHAVHLGVHLHADRRRGDPDSSTSCRRTRKGGKR
jgi:hypothetical protein